MATDDGAKNTLSMDILAGNEECIKFENFGYEKDMDEDLLVQ